MLADHPDIRTKGVAEALAIHPFMLSWWKKEMKDRKLSDKDAVTIPAADLAEAQAEIRRLEKRLAQLEEENDILKQFERFVAEKEQRRSKP